MAPPPAAAAAQLAEPFALLREQLPLPAAPPVVRHGQVSPLLPSVPPALQRQQSDAWLAARVGRQRPDPFDVLFERHWARLRAYCLKFLGNADEAQDAAQETMVRVYQRLWRTKEPAPFKPLLFTIARNLCIDRLRERRRDAGPLDESHLPPAAGADDLAATRGRVDVLVDDLRALSERQRGALALRELSGLSHADIAEALETTPARVKSLISEARQVLADRRAGRELSCEEYRGARSRLRGRVHNQRLLAHRAACARCGEAPLTVHVLGLPALALAWLLRGGRQALATAGGGAPAGAKLAVGLACVATAAVPVASTVGVPNGHVPAGASGRTVVWTPPGPAGSTARRATTAAAVSSRTRGTGAGLRQARPHAALPARSGVAAPLVHRRPVAAGAAPATTGGLRPGAPLAIGQRLRGQVQDTLARTTHRLRGQVDGGPRLYPQVHDAVATTIAVVRRVLAPNTAPSRPGEKFSVADPTLGSPTVVEIERAHALQLTKANPG